MKEDIIGDKALRGRGAVCPSVIISRIVSGKKLHQTQLQAIFFFTPRPLFSLPSVLTFAVSVQSM